MVSSLELSIGIFAVFGKRCDSVNLFSSGVSPVYTPVLPPAVAFPARTDE